MRPAAAAVVAAAGSSSADAGGGGPSSSAASGSGGGGADGGEPGLRGDAADTRGSLDMSEIGRYEEAELSMDQKEAGHQLDAFSMDAERKVCAGQAQHPPSSQQSHSQSHKQQPSAPIGHAALRTHSLALPPHSRLALIELALSACVRAQEGHFDDDFNFVWKRKGEGGNGDEGRRCTTRGSARWTLSLKESSEKVELTPLPRRTSGAGARRERDGARQGLGAGWRAWRSPSRQSTTAHESHHPQRHSPAARREPGGAKGGEEEERADVGVLVGKVAALLEGEGETVAAGLRRLRPQKGKSTSGQWWWWRWWWWRRKRPREGGGGDGGGGEGGGGEGEDLEAVLRAQQFEQLTDLADSLLRVGRYDIYSERKGKLMEEARRASAAAAASAVSASASGRFDDPVVEGGGGGSGGGGGDGWWLRLLRRRRRRRRLLASTLRHTPRPSPAASCWTLHTASTGMVLAACTLTLGPCCTGHHLLLVVREVLRARWCTTAGTRRRASLWRRRNKSGWTWSDLDRVDRSTRAKTAQ